MQNDNTFAETSSPINIKTLDDPNEILKNNIETMTKDHDENVYEIDPVIIISIFFKN